MSINAIVAVDALVCLFLSFAYAAVAGGVAVFRRYISWMIFWVGVFAAACLALRMFGIFQSRMVFYILLAASAGPGFWFIEIGDEALEACAADNGRGQRTASILANYKVVSAVALAATVVLVAGVGGRGGGIEEMSLWSLVVVISAFPFWVGVALLGPVVTLRMHIGSR